MENPIDTLRSSDPRTMLLGLGGDLSIGAAIPRQPLAFDAPDWPAAAGHVALGAVADAAVAGRATAAIGALRRAGLPAVFVYVFDEIWAIGEAVRARVEAMLGSRYVLAEDLWAWEIAPGRAGWPAHRGWSDLLDRERPELVNTWVALSDVTADRSCMHFVPLDLDRRYPHALGDVTHEAAAVRAAPLRAGEALAWNANVLHWGGPCAPDAPGPRTSCSFSLVRADALDALPFPPVPQPERDLSWRLLAIARQIGVYGHGQPDVTPEIRTWAAATCALAGADVGLAARKDL